MMREHNPGGRECIYCKGEHYSASCETITSVPARKEALKKEGRCFVCLARGYCAAQCRRSKRCCKCNHRHHQSLCEIDNSAQNSEGTSSQAMLTAQNPGGTSPSQPQTTLTTAARSKTRVLLQTAQTFAFSVGNSIVPVWILFDNGSQRSYITEKLKVKLSLTPIRQETLHLNVFGSESCNRRKCDVVTLNLQGRDDIIEVMALSFPRICAPLPRHVELHQCSNLHELDLADRPPLDEASESSDCTVDVLIGSDYYWDIVEGEIVRGAEGIVAVRSKFGWLLSGPVKSKDYEYVTHSKVVIHRPFDTQQETDGEGEIVNELRRFWDVESVGITEVNNKEIREESFPASIKYNFINGRYEVNLPWTSNRPDSMNQGMCLVRLRQLLARLKSSPALLQEYNKVFQTQLEANIIEPVPKAEWNVCNTHFLPHHGVVREDKDTTKLRIVFDGSAKVERSHHSFNACLEKGPKFDSTGF